MKPLTAHNILTVWERGEHEHPLERALIILEVCHPDHHRKELASLGIAGRDRMLLTLRSRFSGDTMQAWAWCPACSARNEFTLSAEHLLSSSPEKDEGVHVFHETGFSVSYRIPDSFDLAAVSGMKDGAANELFNRCMVNVVREDDGIGDDTIHASLEEHIRNDDPMAEVLIALKCSGCHHEWQSVFDIAGFLWEEFSAEARRLLVQIHLLAQEYGWSESDILSLGEQRREWYVTMIGG